MVAWDSGALGQTQKFSVEMMRENREHTDLRGGQHGLRLVKRSVRILLHPNVGIMDDFLDVFEEILRDDILVLV
jgi:hypothetical protein